MSREIGSFQDNIRRTFIRFSIVPVTAIVTAAMILFVFSWGTFMASSNEQDNRAIGDELKRIMGIYYDMVKEVDAEVEEKQSRISQDDVFRILYSRTAEFGEIGNLIIFTGNGNAWFSSKDTVPYYLKKDEFKNFGVWSAIKQNKGETSTVLYDGNLCVARGSFDGDQLEYAIVYIVPGDVISTAIKGFNRYVFVTDDNGWVYLSNTRALMDDFGQVNSTISSKMGYLTVDGVRYYSYYSGVVYGLGVYTVNDISRSITLIWILVAIIAVILIGIAVITLNSTASSSERYTRDIKKIENAFEEVQKGNLNVRLDIDSSKEFQIIGNDFNEMVQGLKSQIYQNKELAENAAFLQVKQLESQFNPHFLFNTLDNIRFMAKIDAASADKMIVSLSGLLRYSIRETREEVTVKEDFEILQYYLNILQIRFNKRFSYSIDITEDIRQFLIPKLLMQPLLENAVKYGFGGQEKLTVSIKGYQMQEKLIFICEDDGAGIGEELLSQIKLQLSDRLNSSPHYGLYNIHRRIKLMYGDEYGLDISSKEGEGTLVRLTIPKHS